MENLGSSQEKAARRPEINRVKNLMGSDFFKRNTEEKEIKAKEIIGSFGMQGIETIDDLFNREQAPGYNPQKAQETLRILSTAVYENMNENDLAQAPIAGSYTVEKLLPQAWIGNDAKDPDNGSRFASMVTQNFIDRFGSEENKNKVFAALESVDYTINFPRPNAEEQRLDEIEEAGIASKEIRSLFPSGQGAVEAKKEVLRYLKTVENPDNNQDRAQEESVKVVDSNAFEASDPEVKEYLKAQAEYAERRNLLEKDIEKVSLDELIDAYLHIRAPRERAPQMWEYKVPPEFSFLTVEDWRKLLNFQDSWLGAIYNKRGNSEYNNSLDKMSQMILSMKSLDQADFKLWYDKPELKLHEVMNVIVRELFVKKEVRPENFPKSTISYDKELGGVSDVSENRHVYVFPTTISAPSARGLRKESYLNTDPNNPSNMNDANKVSEFIESEDHYKEKLVKRVGYLFPGDEKGRVAKMSVSMAMNIMEMGGVFTFGDGLRKLTWESDALKLAQRPERKYKSKIEGGELFAGSWTELVNVLHGHDPVKMMETVEEWGVVPKQLAGSFMDMVPDAIVAGEDKGKTIMDLIFENKRINFKEKSNDMYFSWRKDHVMPAARMWMYISGKKTLEFSKNRENDAVISEWRTDLFNDMYSLRGNTDAFLTTRNLAGAIGGSVGLWPFEGPYLRVSTRSRGGSTLDYMSAAIEIMRNLGLEEREDRSIREFFGVGKRFNRDLSDKFVAYQAVRNVSQPDWYIEKNRKVLLRKRK